MQTLGIQTHTFGVLTADITCCIILPEYVSELQANTHINLASTSPDLLNARPCSFESIFGAALQIVPRVETVLLESFANHSKFANLQITQGLQKLRN